MSLAQSERSIDPFGAVRRVLRKVHLWIAMALCLPLVVLGLTGSILVFRGELAELLDPPPRLDVRAGQPHSVGEIITAAQDRLGNEFTPFLYEAPRAPTQPATVRLFAAGSGAVGVLIDPVSLDLVRWHHSGFPGFVGTLVRLHGNLLLGRAGRPYVGWLGVAMLVLGVSGLILWWPRRNRWRAAFVVRRGARGLRLYRELHGALGIWSFVVFLTVGFSGVYLAFPQTVGAVVRTLLPSHAVSDVAPIVKVEGTQRIDSDRAIAAALSAVPGARLLSIALPRRPEQTYRVTLARADDRPGAPEIVAQVNPWSGEVVQLIDPARFAPAQSVLAWLGRIHFGDGLGWVWRVLVCLCGLLPAVFAVTGIAMWLIKRRARGRGGRTLSA